MRRSASSVYPAASAELGLFRLPWWRRERDRLRVAKLYAPGRYFLCRDCYRLAYAS
jgi:hypothetical protein